MDFNLLTLDFQNNSFYVKNGDFEYLWTNPQIFVSEISFPFNDVVTLSYEPQRALYLLELTFGRHIHGRDSTEMQWIEEHFDKIVLIAKNKQSTEAAVTVEIMRLQKLYDTDWVVQRHIEQKTLSAETTISDEIYTALLEYRQKLRDLSLAYNLATLASDVSWPTNPLD